MANSDNVVRAGLTPKFKDTDTLISIMDYNTNEIPVLEGNPKWDEMVYETPAEEFRMSRLSLTSGLIKKERTGGKPQILLVTKGEIVINWSPDSDVDRLELQKGQSVFIPALLKEFEIHADHSADIFKAIVP